ncbi:RNA-directed DNA polymerase [uncultured Sanguibacteroides sp.]|uniref:RNA-directed DNA polymerase n=1 Tax=uncultured Sanguibacteroides sp. TaxID=1635151 RepID=UPI0025E8B8CF|nr:RNA-directed DNA polymerase [uncultured Sanguibacteroides sp.]
MKTILDLTRTKALDYFLQTSNYTTISFPKYFEFKKILDFVKNKIGEKDFRMCLKDKKISPSDYDTVNYDFLVNKDGRYAYRPLQLANPFLYYFLAREITKDTNWKFLKKRFNDFKNPNLEVVSIPLVKEENDKSTMATTIKSWWEHIEQRSIELSLEYKYIFITDITNCYCSIYTHSVSWALHGMDYAKEHREEKNLGKLIDNYIMGMQYGQTNGIPQGSILFDFIAEIVLGYSDLLLFKELQKKGITDYKILRYRDDYRIFSNNKEEIEKITMTLQITLAKLNFQLNSIKTKLSEDIVENSIKEDKLYYIANIPIYKGERTIFNTFQQELLFILQFSKKHPNSGTLSKLLTMFLKRLSTIENLKEDANVLSAIITEIAMNSPKVYSLAVSIISNLINHLKTTKEREKIAKNISNKFSRLPNIGYLELWMQRITFHMTSDMGYTEPLCKIVKGEPDIQIWNNQWLKDEYTVGFPLYSMCTNWIRDKYTPIIDIDEVSVFDY